MPKKVTGFAGIFFSCTDPDGVREWYNRHLGFNIDQYGNTFEWRHAVAPEQKDHSV